MPLMTIAIALNGNYGNTNAGNVFTTNETDQIL
jgi:hypothetical protein